MEKVKVFIDTAPIIYLAETEGKRSDSISGQLEEWIEKDYLLLTSSITLAEILVHPKKKNDSALVSRYKEILEELLSSPLLPLDAVAAELSAEYRAKYNLNAPDAFQAACAVSNGCRIFYTNDRKLRRVKEIEVVVV